MHLIGLNTLSAEDAAIILELTPILDIVYVKAIGASEMKFFIKTQQGIRRLLRIKPMSDYKWMKDDDRGYEYMATVGINVSRQVSEGFFGNAHEKGWIPRPLLRPTPVPHASFMRSPLFPQPEVDNFIKPHTQRCIPCHAYRLA